MEFKTTITKKGIELEVESRLDGTIYVRFEGKTLACIFGIVSDGLRFTGKEGTLALNKKMGTKDINGIKLETEHIEKIENLKKTALQYVINQANVLAETITEKSIIDIYDFGTFISFNFNFDSKIPSTITDLAKKILIEKYNLGKIQGKNLTNLKAKDADYGDYSTNYTYKESIEKLLKISEQEQIKNEEIKKRKEETKKIKDEEIKKENHYYDFEAKVIKKGKENNEDLFAKVEVIEKATGEKRKYYCRNIFDFGYVVNLEKGGFANEGDEFDKRANKYLNAFSPVETNIRM
jgi:hypothetical protein